MERESRETAGLNSVLRGFRQVAGLTQRELAGRAGLSVGVVRDLEQGRTRHPSGRTVAALATALDLTTAQAAELELAAGGRGLWLRILGPLLVWRDGAEVRIPGEAQRAVLGLLALSPGSLVHRATIIDVLWPHNPPASAAGIVQARLSRLRTTLGEGGLPGGGPLLASTGGGYRLRVGTDQLDLLRFRRVAADARAASSRGEYRTACRLYEQALGQWQGEPLADVELLRGLPAISGLARQRTDALIEYARAASAAGWHEIALPALWELTGHEPLNEQAHARLMIALAGSGQSAAALTVYHELRGRLDEELGMPPGQDLTNAYQLVITQEIPATRTTVVTVMPSPPDQELVVPRQLPARTRQFAGRDRELKALSELLDGTETTVVISAVAGTAGVGKTALAVHWAHQMMDRFPDGQLYADLRGWGPAAEPMSPADLIGRFLAALGVPADRMPADAGARQDLYRSLLAGRRVLIVLDNARDANQVRPLLPSGSSSVVLVTSRSQLTSLVALEAARPLFLDVLTLAEARELLVQRLGSERVAAEPDAADEVAGLCARLPLALAIAASRAVLRPALSLATLADELRDAGGRLAILDAGEGISMDAVLSWSYRQLPEAVQRTFRLLGIHPGPDISTVAVMSLTGTSLVQARMTLQHLVEASLLTEHLPGRFRFHDLLRAYAAERASDEDDPPAQRAALHRTLDHYLHSAFAADHRLGAFPAAITPAPPVPGVAPEQFSDLRQAMAWFRAERPVLAEVAGLAASTGFDTHGWQLPLALARFDDRTGNSGMSLALQRAALACASRLHDRQAQLRVCTRIGNTCVRLGDYTDAEYHYQQAADISAEIGDRVRQARAYLGLGFVADHQGRYRDALAHAIRTLSLSRPDDDMAFHGSALANVGWCYAQLGEYEQALPYIQQALEIQRDGGDTATEAHAWDSQGYVLRHLGRYTDAIASYVRALALFCQIDDRADEGVTLDNLGDTYHAAGQPGPAVQAWHRSMTILDELEHPRAEGVRGKLQHAAGR